MPFLERFKQRKNDAIDKFIEDCLKVEFKEIPDKRVWSEIPTCKAIAEAGNFNIFDEALSLLTTLKEEYPDFWFPYCWFAIVYRKQKRYNDSINVLFEGLHVSKSKYTLYAQMGKTFWETRNLSESIIWWIRSIIVQIDSNTLEYDTPFLWLSYVAEQLGDKSSCQKLRWYVDNMNTMTHRLNPDVAREVYIVTESQGTESMKKAIKIIERNYLSKFSDK
jgi:hypothetical protein